jgi:hypothetical protein
VDNEQPASPPQTWRGAVLAGLLVTSLFPVSCPPTPDPQRKLGKISSKKKEEREAFQFSEPVLRKVFQNLPRLGLPGLLGRFSRPLVGWRLLCCRFSESWWLLLMGPVASAFRAVLSPLLWAGRQGHFFPAASWAVTHERPGSQGAPITGVLLSPQSTYLLTRPSFLVR